MNDLMTTEKRMAKYHPTNGEKYGELVFTIMVVLIVLTILLK